MTLGVGGLSGEGGEGGLEDMEGLWSGLEGERRILVPLRSAGDDADI